MKIWNFIKKIFKNTCVYFTLISIAFMILGIIGGSDASGIGFKTSALLFIPFGVCMALAQELLCAKNLSAPARYLGHYFITIVSFFLCFIIPSVQDFDGIVVILFLSILYWIIFGIALLIHHRLKKLMEED